MTKISPFVKIVYIRIIQHVQLMMFYCDVNDREREKGDSITNTIAESRLAYFRFTLSLQCAKLSAGNNTSPREFVHSIDRLRKRDYCLKL